MKLVNLYWLQDGKQERMQLLTINEATEIAARILRNGGEITSIIDSEWD